MSEQKFFYVSYIKTTPHEVWDALTSPAFTRQYWMGNDIESDWKPGSPIQLRRPNGGPAILSGKILTSERPKHLSYTWTVLNDEEMKAEKPSQVTFLIELFEGNSELVKLSVTHDGFPANSKTFGGITIGWPMVLSGLKSLLETKKGLEYNRACAGGG